MIVFFDTLSALPFAKLRQEERPRKYAFIKLLGIIINVTKKEEEIELEQKEAAKREEALQRLIDQELEADDKQPETGNYSIEDSSKNPMDAVLNK